MNAFKFQVLSGFNCKVSAFINLTVGGFCNSEQ